MSDVYVSLDIETTGFIPGLHSMISLGAVAYRDGEEFGSFECNLEEVYGRDEETMEWWKQFPEAWKRSTRMRFHPAGAMFDFASFLEDIRHDYPDSPISFAADPSTFDASFIWHYAWTFLGPARAKRSIGRFRMFDIRTLRASLFNVDYSASSRELYPACWNDEGTVVKHTCLDDAREQGNKLMHLLDMQKTRVAKQLDKLTVCQ